MHFFTYKMIDISTVHYQVIITHKEFPDYPLAIMDKYEGKSPKWQWNDNELASHECMYLSDYVNSIIPAIF